MLCVGRSARPWGETLSRSSRGPRRCRHRGAHLFPFLRRGPIRTFFSPPNSFNFFNAPRPPISLTFTSFSPYPISSLDVGAYHVCYFVIFVLIFTQCPLAVPLLQSPFCVPQCCLVSEIFRRRAHPPPPLIAPSPGIGGRPDWIFFFFAGTSQFASLWTFFLRSLLFASAPLPAFFHQSLKSFSLRLPFLFSSFSFPSVERECCLVFVFVDPLLLSPNTGS